MRAAILLMAAAVWTLGVKLLGGFVMKHGIKRLCLSAGAAIGAFGVAVAPADATLTVFKSFTGNVALSTGGFGSLSQSGKITVNALAGSTVLGAYLYSSSYGGSAAVGGTFNGSAVSYTGLGINTVAGLQAFRADVTSIVAPIINGGAGGAYSFSVTETSGYQDGEALVLVYSNSSLATSTIGILDGFSSSAGDSSSINFATPLDPTAAGFVAEMRIGDGFSCCNQASTIKVNGQTLTTVAGNNDDSTDGSAANGNLFTIGDDNDPYTVATPGSPATNYATDHERYNLAPFINKGDTSINISTVNPSNDDNIFLETFKVTGLGSVVSSSVPEPASWAMMVGGFGFIGSAMRRKKAAVSFS